MAILMSVIHKNGEVTIATDSSSGEDRVRKNSSVKHDHDVLYGWIGKEPFHNFMTSYCPKFKFSSKEDPYDYLTEVWRKLYIEALYQFEILSRNGGAPDVDGRIHIVYKKSLFEVREDISITHSEKDTLYAGNGTESAKFMYDTIKQWQAKKLLKKLSEGDLIRNALESARDNGYGIRGPIHILTI